MRTVPGCVACRPYADQWQLRYELILNSHDRYLLYAIPKKETFSRVQHIGQIPTNAHFHVVSPIISWVVDIYQKLCFQIFALTFETMMQSPVDLNASERRWPGSAIQDASCAYRPMTSSSTLLYQDYYSDYNSRSSAYPLPSLSPALFPCSSAGPTKPPPEDNIRNGEGLYIIDDDQHRNLSSSSAGGQDEDEMVQGKHDVLTGSEPADTSFTIEAPAPLIGHCVQTPTTTAHPSLRATHATKDMKKVMGVFRLDPFILKGGSWQQEENTGEDMVLVHGSDHIPPIRVNISRARGCSMGGVSKPEISSIVTGDLDSIPTAHVDTSGKVISPTLLTTHPNKPSGSTLSTGMGFADSCVDEDKINAMPPTPSLIRFVLGNFFFATFSIFLTLFIVFTAVTWLTVLRDARSMRDQVLSNANGVSLYAYCNKRVLLTVTIPVGINTRSEPSTGSGCTCIIRFMGGCGLRCARDF